MSKYARTRKAICRVSKLSNWIVNREEFRKLRIKSWKESYKDYRKLLFLSQAPYKIPCKYKEALMKYPDIWNLVPDSIYY